MADEHEESLS